MPENASGPLNAPRSAVEPKPIATPPIWLALAFVPITVAAPAPAAAVDPMPMTTVFTPTAVVPLLPMAMVLTPLAVVCAPMAIES